MKITVVGATGQVGAQVVRILRADGHEVVEASRSVGVDVIAGEGLVEAVRDADVLVDVLNSPSYDDGPVMDFFVTSSKNLVAAAQNAKVGHYLVLSIVNCDQMPSSGYMRAKVVQEATIMGSGIPYTIVRATQFHEFAEGITESLAAGDEIRVPDARIQLVASAEVAREIARRSAQLPVNRIINMGGPETLSFAEMARGILERKNDERAVIVDPNASYFGNPLQGSTLLTDSDSDAVIGSQRFADWLGSSGVLGQ